MSWYEVMRNELETAHRLFENGGKMAEKVDSQLNKIRNNPSLVRSFFGHPSVAYISDL